MNDHLRAIAVPILSKAGAWVCVCVCVYSCIQAMSSIPDWGSLSEQGKQRDVGSWAFLGGHLRLVCGEEKEVVETCLILPCTFSIFLCYWGVLISKSQSHRRRTVAELLLQQTCRSITLISADPCRAIVKAAGLPCLSIYWLVFHHVFLAWWAICLSAPLSQWWNQTSRV